MAPLVAPAALAQRKPLNFVMIYCDDLGYGDLGCYGSSIRTPHMDSLARDGMRFTDFHSGNPVCSPSRAALLTGRHNTRVNVPRVFFPRDDQGLPTNEITIARHVRAHGYATACVGKWHLGHKHPHLPTDHGFDEYFGIPYSNDMNPRWLMEGDRVLEEQTPLDTLTPPLYRTRGAVYPAQQGQALLPVFPTHLSAHSAGGVEGLSWEVRARPVWRRGGGD